MAIRNGLWLFAMVLVVAPWAAGQGGGGAAANEGLVALESTPHQPPVPGAVNTTSTSPPPPTPKGVTALELDPRGPILADDADPDQEPEPEPIAEAESTSGGGGADSTDVNKQPLPKRSEAEDRAVGEAPAVTSGMDWARTLGALALVVGLIFAAKWLLKRFGAVKSVGGSAGVVEVLSRTAVSAKHSVMLIRVGSRLLVVAAGGDTMNTLTEIDDPQQISELLGAVERGRSSSLTNTFARALNRQEADLAVESEAVEAGELKTPVAGAVEQIKGMIGRLRRQDRPGGRP